MSALGDLFVERLLEMEKDQIIDREVIKQQRCINKKSHICCVVPYTVPCTYSCLTAHLSVNGVGSVITWIYEYVESAISCVYRLLADILKGTTEGWPSHLSLVNHVYYWWN